ncbi:hypothetical protein GpartN1_g4637.t1 [Galdieria partita]|uniref:Ribosomal RNA-processing protein 40 n=1 Tax=Galdieria partita TaxID=83374 RepID=A0A9C7PYD5_9RHOD|nr:hypothetical protein GpartN1_g4637.t1 [Galdieria partita]
MISKFDDVFVFPGDKLFKLENGDNIRIGQGILKKGDCLVAVKPGYLHKDGNKVWVETAQKRYIPAVGDLVIGVVVDRSSEFYQVDVGGFSTALLPLLAFEGATKRNRPHLSVGSAVYARVVSVDRDSEPQLSCLLPGTQHSWVTGETVFGELKQGNLIHCSISLCRNILLGRNTVFTELGKYIPFEQATGMNGRIWVRSQSAGHVVLLSNLIICSENMTNDQLSGMIRSLVSKMTTQMSPTR